MARSPRITISTYPYHIIQRGNNRAATFFADDDYRFFLECLRQAKVKCQCRIYSYVLMTNHFHLLVEPAEVGHPKDYRWSSYRRRALGKSDRLLDEDPWYGGLGATERERQEKYQQWIASQISQGE